MIENGMGMGAQIKRARDRAIMGAKTNRVREEAEGWTGSLINSLTPSAMG